MNKKSILSDKKLINTLIYLINLTKIDTDINSFQIDKIEFYSLHSLINHDNIDCNFCNKDKNNIKYEVNNFYSDFINQLINQIKIEIVSSQNKIKNFNIQKSVSLIIYNKKEIQIFKFLCVIFNKKGLDSNFKISKIINKINKKDYFLNNIKYYLESELKLEQDFSKQIIAIKNYEETFGFLQNSILSLFEIFDKMESKVSFSTNLYNLYEIAKKVQFYKNKSKEKINSIKNISNREEIVNETLLVTISLIYRFIFNEYTQENYINIYDFSEMEKKLNEYFENDKRIILKFDTKDDSIKIIHISGSNLISQNKKDFRFLFPKEIRNESVKILLKNVIKEQNSTKLMQMEMIINSEEKEENNNFLNLMSLRFKIIPEMDLSKIILTGKYEISKENFILFKKNEDNVENIMKNYSIILISKIISEVLFLNPKLLNYFRTNKILFTFDEIFDKSLNSEDINENEISYNYIINYKKLKKTYDLKLSDFYSRDIKNILLAVDNLSRNKTIIQLILKKKNLFLNNKKFILFSYNIIKQRKTIFNNFNEVNKIEFEEEDELEKDNEKLNSKHILELKSGFNPSLLDSDGSSLSSTLNYRNNDYNGFSIKRSDTNLNYLNSLNEIYRNKIHTIFNINLIICFCTIILACVFIIICILTKNKLNNLINLENKLSSFQDNFYYSIMFTFSKYFIIKDIPDDQIYYSYLNSAISRFENINLNEFQTFMKEDAYLTIEKASLLLLELKNDIYNLQLDQNLDVISDYFTINANDGIIAQSLEFFDFINLLLKNTRIISDRNEPSLVFLVNYQNGNFQANQNFYNSLNNNEKIEYETIINYSTCYKNMEIYESFIYDNFNKVLEDLNFFIYLFSILSVGLHFIIIIVCFISIRTFRRIILNANLTISHMSDRRNKILMEKFKILKIIIDNYSNPTINFKKLIKQDKNSKKFVKAHQTNSKIKIDNANEDESSLLVGNKSVEFDSKSLIQPFLHSIIFGFFTFFILLLPFFLIILNSNYNIEKISNIYITETDLGHTIINNYIFTKISILTNETDSEILQSLEGNESIGEGFIFNNFVKIQNLIYYQMKKFNFFSDFTTKEGLEQINCDYIYSINNRGDFPKKLCNSLSFSRPTTNLFYNSIEVINYKNKQILDNLNFSDRSYDKLIQIYNNFQLFDLSLFLVFVIKPFQVYIKENLILSSFNNSADSFILIIIIFFIFNIILEIILFSLIHFKFNSKILEADVIFSDFLLCLQ